MNKRLAQQITEGNRWFARLARILNSCYAPSVASKLIEQTARDIVRDGNFSEARKYWHKFMEHHIKEADNGYQIP